MVLELILLSVVIGSNNFAASLALGSLGQVDRKWRIVAVFGVFEFVVPLLGLWAGQQTARNLGDIVSRLGPALRGLLGLWTIIAAFSSREDAERMARRVTCWQGLIALAAGLSFDNMVAGFSLGLGNREPLMLAASIAAFAMVFSYIGLRLGNLAHTGHRQAARIATGILLLGLATALALGLV